MDRVFVYDRGDCRCIQSGKCDSPLFSPLFVHNGTLRQKKTFFCIFALAFLALEKMAQKMNL